MKPPAPLPLEEAQARLLDLVRPLAKEVVPVEASLGRYLTESLSARRTQPAANLSAMDGYAVASANLDGPWHVVGESAAGHPYADEVLAGQAVRIATGAVIPAGADSVILQEDISRDGNSISLSGDLPQPFGKHIRREGMDFRDGDQVLQAGTLIGPAQAALAISSGHLQVTVSRKPKVAVIDSGDELSSQPDLCAVHQIPASNGAMLMAMAQSVPCTAQRFGPVADDMDAIASVLAKAEDADVIVTSGGASVGDHDLIRPAMAAWGADIDFWRVAIKPGKPLLVATREGPSGRQIILGLPGNPVSSHVTAYLFMLPLLRALLGAADPLPKTVTTRLAEDLKANGSRREFMRAYWDGTRVTAKLIQDSGALATLAASNALIDRPANAQEGKAGDEVPIFLIRNGGIC